jgi:RNA polymerase sigma factor (sigma-70 family)
LTGILIRMMGDAMAPARLSERQRQTAAEVLAEHGAALWRIALVLSGSRQDAEDLLAAAVLRALPHLDREELQVPAYLRRVMLNLRASQWRRRRGVREITTDVPRSHRQLTVADHGDEVALRADVAACLQRLGPRQRAVVILRYLEDRTVADTARILGCTAETVRSQAHRALARLRSDVPALFADADAGNPAPADGERTPS